MVFKKFLLTIICIIFLIGIVSGANFDNAISYEKNDLKVNFDNWFGLGNHLGDIELKSHKSVDEIKKVLVGENRVVMYYDFNFPNGYANGLGDVEFINEKTKQTISKDYYFAQAVFKEVPINEYVCDNVKTKNGTIIDDCHNIQTGTRQEVSEWKRLDSNDIPSGNVRIGLITDVNFGDYYDAKWSIIGKKVSRHASWTESLNSGLVAYWSANETSGTSLPDVHHSLHDSTNQNMEDADWVSDTTSCVIGECLSFDGDPEHSTTGSSDLGLSDEDVFTANIWVNVTTLQSATDIFTQGGGGSGWTLNARDGSTSACVTDGSICATGSSLSTNTWHMITGVYNGTGINLYIDGSFVTGNAGTSNYNTNAIVFARHQTNTNSNRYLIGALDEAGFWNRTLSASEISDLYNSGGGITYKDTFPGKPVLSIVYPTLNNTNYSITDVEASSSVVDADDGIQNVSILIDDILTQTNSSGQNVVNYNFTETLSEGRHKIQFESYDNGNLRGVSDVIYVTVDLTNPEINVTQPHGLFYHISGNSINLNWNFTEKYPDECRYEYKGINTTLDCGDNTTTISDVSEISNTTLIFYSNDSAGNTNNIIVNWNYSLWENERGSHNATIEGSTELYYLDFVINSGSLSTAKIWYEGNDTATSFTQISGRNYNATINDFAIPLTNVNKVVNFFWQVNYGSTEVNTTTSSQHINALTIDDCSSNPLQFYNFSIFDEENNTRLLGVPDSNTTANLNIQVYGYSTETEILSYNNSFVKTNPFVICLSDDLGASKYSHYVQVQYFANGYETELYHVQNRTLNSTNLPRNISLYDLNSTDSQDFKITFRDSSYIPVENALINIYRKYINENSFKIVEIPKTDNNGETTSHLVVNDVIYNFEIMKFGKVLATFNNVHAVCQTPLVSQCEIKFNAFPENINVPDYETSDNLNYTLGYDSSTKTITASFVVLDSSSSWVSLNVTKTDALETSGCNDDLTSTQGTLSCVVPDSFGNSTVLAKLYKNGELIGEGTVKVNQDPSDYYGSVLVVLAFFVLLTLMGASISSNPVFTIFSFALGIILLFSINLVANNGFIGGTATILFLMVGIIIVAIKISRRT